MILRTITITRMRSEIIHADQEELTRGRDLYDFIYTYTEPVYEGMEELDAISCETIKDILNRQCCGFDVTRGALGKRELKTVNYCVTLYLSNPADYSTERKILLPCNRGSYLESIINGSFVKVLVGVILEDDVHINEDGIIDEVKRIQYKSSR